MIARLDAPATPRSVLLELFAQSAAATASGALEQAAARARSQGFVALQLGVQAATDVRELANFHAAIALQCVRHGTPMAPTVMVSGGALLDGATRASAAEFLLALALALDAQRGIYAYACGPDVQTDGSTGFGALIGPDTLARAKELRINLGERLVTSQAKSTLELLGDYKKLTSAPANGATLRAILIAQD